MLNKKKLEEQLFANGSYQVFDNDMNSRDINGQDYQKYSLFDLNMQPNGRRRGRPPKNLDYNTPKNGPKTMSVTVQESLSFENTVQPETNYINLPNQNTDQYPSVPTFYIMEESLDELLVEGLMRYHLSTKILGKKNFFTATKQDEDVKHQKWHFVNHF